LVTLDNHNRIIGYVHARLEKRLNRGEFEEIVVDPEQDFVQVARPLVEKVNNMFVEKKVTSVVAGSLRNPAYEKIFPALGFFESESMGVFMYAILDAQKFLNELASVFTLRLKKLAAMSGLVQIECDGSSLFLQKAQGNVESIVWTNQPIDFKVTLTRDVLTKLVFGIADTIEFFKAGQLRIETTLSQEKTVHLLRALFPKKQFLIMDNW